MVFVFSLRGGPIQEPKFRISRGGVYTLRMAGYIQRAFRIRNQSFESRVGGCILFAWPDISSVLLESQIACFIVGGGYILFAWPDISSVLPELPGLPGLQGLPELRARVGWIFEWHGACGGPAVFPKKSPTGLLEPISSILVSAGAGQNPGGRPLARRTSRALGASGGRFRVLTALKLI